MAFTTQQRLMSLGVPTPLAKELGRQMDTGTYNVFRLIEMGMPPGLAKIVATDPFNKIKAVQLGMPPAVATLIDAGGSWSPLALGSTALAWWAATMSNKIGLSGASVASWTDAVNGYVASQATGANRPTYDPSSFDGDPALTFNGTNSYLTVESQPLPSGNTPVEMWAVVSQDALPADTATRRWLSYGGTSNNDTRQGSRFVTGGVNRATAGIGNGSAQVTALAPAVDFSGIHVVRIVVTSTNTTIYVDGIYNTASAVVPATGATRITIGAALAAAGYWQGQIKHIVVTGLLTEGQAIRMWDWGFSEAHNALGISDFLWLDGDSFSTIQGGDGLPSRFKDDGLVVWPDGVGGSTLAEATTRVLSRPWARSSVLVFWDGNPNGHGTVSEDMARYMAIASYVPKSIIIPPVRRGVVDTPDMLAHISELQAAIASEPTLVGRTGDLQAVLAAAATSPGDDPDVAGNVVPRSLLIDRVTDAHLNASGWNAAYPAIKAIKDGLGW